MSGISSALRITGWSLEIFAGTMILPLLLDFSVGNEDWRIFGFCSLMVFFLGAAMVLSVGAPSVVYTGNASARTETDTELRTVIIAILMTALSVIWAGSLPFMFGSADCSIPDALFETVARITTSGGTIFDRLSELPPGLTLWRGILQWLGGIGALALGIAVLPFLQVGGMGFFRSDALAALEPTYRAKRLSVSLLGLYSALTLFLIVLLWLAGMPGLDAVVHGMGLISTGGGSTWNSSLGHYNRAAIDLVAALGMILAGLPFPLLLGAVRGNVRALFAEGQVKWYLSILLIGTRGLCWWGMRHWGWTLAAAFHDNGIAVISALTGTGYTTQASLIWTGFPAIILLFLATLGGCAGSTTGGLKIFRFQAVLSEVWGQMKSLLRPHAIRSAKVDGRVLYRVTRNQITGYVFIYTVSFAGLAWGLGAFGLDALTALSASVSALANSSISLGPTLGHPDGYLNLPDGAKLLLAAGMLLGRLEILPVLVLFTPTFWRK